MDINYSKVFTDSMTEKEICFKYFEISDAVIKGSEDEKALDDAFLEAIKAAKKRDARHCDAIRNTMPESVDCVVCM